MLDWILMVTITTTNLAMVESAYRDDLGYEVLDRGEIKAALAESWGALGSTGNRYLLMRPASGTPVYLRFIETNTAGNHVPHASEGWNAAEMLVKDPDDLAQRLRGSRHFKIVGPPAYLTAAQDIRAMQVIGPSNEMLYLTRIVHPENMDLDLGTAESFVDRVFIVVVGAHNFKELTEFYRTLFTLTVTDPEPYRIAVLSRAYGLPEDQLHRLSMAILPNQSFLELDEYPAYAPRRRIDPGELPAGIAMVTFEVESLDGISVPFIAPPVVSDAVPYDGRRAGTVRGAAGELIELVESGRNGSHSGGPTDTLRGTNH